MLGQQRTLRQISEKPDYIAWYRTNSARVTDMETECMNIEQSEQPDYLSYLMRVWRTPTDSGHTWRASLEEPRTQEVHGFKDLQSLFAFLLAQIGQQEK